MLNASPVAQDLVASFNGGKVSAQSLESAQNAAKTSTIGLTIAQTALNMALSLGLTALISLIIKGYDELSNSVENCKKRVDDLVSSYNSALDIANNNAKRVEELADKYESLSEGVNKLGENISLTNEEYEQYNSLTNEIAEMFPTLVQGWTDEGNAILNLKGNIEQLRDAYKEAQQEAYNLLIVSGKDSDGNDIIKQWEDTHETGFWSDMLNLGADKVGAGISVADALKQLIAIQQMSADEYREIERIVGSGSRKEISGLTDIEKEIGYGSYLYEALGLDSNSTDEEFRNAQKQAKALVQTYNAEIESALSDVETLANAYLMTNEDYDNLDSQLKTAASLIVNSLNADIANKFSSKEDVGTYVDGIVQSLSSNEDIQKALVNLFSIDSTNMSINETQQQVDKYVGTIATELDENPVELKTRLGFDDSDVKPLVNKVQGYLNDEFDSKVGELTLDELNTASELEIPEGTLLSWDELITKIREAQDTASGNTPTLPSIIDSWNSLIDTDEEELKNTRKDLLALAEAGQLTAETFHDTTGADTFLDGISESLPEAIDWINQLVSSSTQLQSMSAQISKMSDMLADKKNGTTASADDLSGFDASVKGLESWEEFERVMGSSKSSMEECQAAANALATEWVNNGNFLANLTEENKDYYITQMENMGIQNAATIVTNQLTTAQQVAENTEKALSLATSDLNDKQASYTQRSVDVVNATYEQSAAFVEHANMSAAARVQLADLVAEQTIFNNQGLNVADKIAALSELAGAYLGAAAQASFLAKTQGGLNSSYRISAEEAWAQVQDEFSKINTTVTPTVKINPSGSSGYKGSSSKKSGSDSKQTIDWISRLLDVLQKKIDTTKAKFDNLFTLKDKKNNLAEQIKLTKNLLTATTIAADRYKKAASKVGLSKELKDKVENGSYDITEYGSKTAEKIQKYQSYLDSYNDLIQQEEELRTKIRGLKSDDYQLSIDNAENNIAKLDAQMENSSSYKERIKYLKEERKYIRESYYNQIKQAELDGELAKADELRAKRKKELTDNSIAQFQQEADNAQSKLDKSQAYAALDEGNYKAQNKHLEAQKKYTKDYYKAQIQIAKKNGDLIEADRLRAEKQKELNDLSKQEFDNISDTYNKKLQLLDAKAQSINNQIGIIEAKGYVVSADYYNSLTTNTKKNLSELTDELIALRQKRDEMLKDGTLKKGTTAWYEIQSAIWSVKNAQDNATKSLIEYENQIRQLKWDAFDRQEDFISQIQDEGNWLIDLMSNEKLFDDSGNWTEYANATAGLRAVNYNAYMAQADDYEKEIKAIQQEINNDPYNIDLIKRKQELISAQRELIKSANQEQEAIKSLVSDGYDKWLDALQKSIDLRKKELDNVSDLYTYQKNIAKLAKETANYEKQWLALQGDNSEENKSRLQKVTVALQDSRDSLEESEYEQWKRDQESMLDALADDAQEWVNQRLDNIDGLISDVIKSTNTNSTAIKDTLEKVTSDVGTTLSSDMTKIWNTADGISSVVSDYGDKLSGGITTVGSTLTSIKDYVEKISNASDKPSDTNTDYDFNPEQYSQKQQVSSFIDSHKQEATRERDYYKALNQYIYDATGGYVLSKTDEAALANLLNVNIYSDLTGDAGRVDLERILAALKLTGYAKGGVISSISDAIRLNGDSVLVSANPGERILTAEQNENWEKWTKELPNLVNLTDVIKPNVNIPETINRNVGNNIEKIEMEINLPGVTNYEEFKSNLIRDRQFEKAVQTMTLDRALGGNSLNKYKIR